MVRRVFTCSLAVLFGLVVQGGRSDERPPPKDALALQEAFQSVIQEAEPAIACVIVSRSSAYKKLFKDEPPPQLRGKLGSYDPPQLRRQFPEVNFKDEEIKRLDLENPLNVPESYGSGVVIDDKGLILTNRHVIDKATKIYVRFPGGKGSYADIYADDPRSDLAVLKLLNPPQGLKAIKMGDASKVRKGQLVLTLANPFAAGFRDGSPSASYGIISNIRRRGPGKLNEIDREKTLDLYGSLLQIDARLNLGCSGGALIDLKGELIGLTTSLAALAGTETSGGFAVPMDAGMKRIINVLKEGKEVEYGFLGVALYDPFADDSEIPRSKASLGAHIRTITGNSPAHKAEIAPKEIIVTVNGATIRDNDDLFLALGTLLAGSEAKVEVRSALGTTRTVTVVLAKYYVPAKSIVSVRPAHVRGLRVDYTSLLVQHSLVLPRSMDRGIPEGVVISEVASGSRADKASLRANQVITHVNGKAVLTPADFYREVAESEKKKDPIRLKLQDSTNEVTLQPN